MSQFYKLKVEERKFITPDAISLSFSIPLELKEKFQFSPGQHLTLKLSINGKDVRRCYSICSKVDDKNMSIAIKQVPNGMFSSYAITHIQPGDEIEVMPPQGVFGLSSSQLNLDEYTEHNLLLAMGSGITPIISILKYLLTHTKNEVTLIYGNRSLKDTMFYQEILELKNMYIDRLQNIFIFSKQKHEIDLFNGRIDAHKLMQIHSSLCDISNFQSAYICGPVQAFKSIKSALVKNGMSPEHIHIENFYSSMTSPQVTNQASFAQTRVQVKQDGRIHEFEMDDSDSNLLDAALKQGIDLPYACKGGVCSTCICKVKKGEVELLNNFSLEADQLDKGYILSCQAVPKSKHIHLDFDN